MQVAGRVLERAEDQHLLALQFAGQSSFSRQLAVVRRPGSPCARRALEQLDVGLHVVGQLPQVELVQIDRGQALDVRPWPRHGVEFLGQAAGRQVVFLVPGQEPHRLLEILRRDDLAVQQVVLVGLLEGQRPAQAQAERLDARLQPLQEAGLEDADQGHLPGLASHSCSCSSAMADFFL